MAVETIPSERKALYYLGMAFIGAGLLLFLSNFFIMFDSGSSLPRNDIPMDDPKWWEKSQAQHDE